MARPPPLPPGSRMKCSQRCCAVEDPDEEGEER
jgi:hypothetical protein